MAESIVSSIVFVLMVIILSLLVDGKAFAAHRKLNGGTETTTMKRYLEESGNKIDANHSISHRGGQKNTDKEPDEVTPQGHNSLSEYIQRRMCTESAARCAGEAAAATETCQSFRRQCQRYAQP